MGDLNIRNVDETLRRRFKALCAERGRSMSEEVQRLMTEELRRAGREIRTK